MSDHLLVARGEDVFTPALHLYYPVVAERGEGSYIETTEGKRYLDFSSGIAVLNIGHRHPRVLSAVHGQLDRLIHTGGVYYNRTTVLAAEKLLSITPQGLDKLFFSNSGAEAVEGALKLARFVTGRQGIISFTGAFHGRTLGALSITTSSAKYRSRYHPLLPSIWHSPYPSCFRCPFHNSPDKCEFTCLDFLKELFRHQITPEEVAAIIIEPMLGEGGYYPAPAGFLQELRRLCNANGIMLIFDEVQSGMGRSGLWFAGEHADVIPDIMVVAKGIASGFPLSAVISTREIMDKWPMGAHGTTFGGNPVSCAAAIATIEVIQDENLLERSSVMSKTIISRLRDAALMYPVIGDVRGYGFMIGIEFVTDSGSPNQAACQQVMEHSLSNGLILIGCGTERNIIRFIPPLTATEQELNQAIDVIIDGVGRLP